MAPSEAQKKAANKYNMKNMATIGCKIKKDQAAAFKEYAAAQGKTSNSLLREFVLDCIEEKGKK